MNARVLMVIAEMGAGGAEAVVRELALDAVRRHDEVTVASSGGWRTDELRSEGVRVLPVGLRGRSVLDLSRSALTLASELRSRPPAVVHAHNVKAAVVSRLGAIALRHRPPIVVTLHGVADDRYRWTARALGRCADRVVAVSPHVAERIIGAGLPAERVDVIENAVCAPPGHDRTEARTRLALPHDAVIVLCIARLVPQKRHDLLIAACKHLPAHAVILLVGEGETRPSLEAAIAGAGLGDRVRLLGERRDVDWLLAAADVSVLPTRWEGLPISVLEGMAAGVPVVATAVSGLAESLDGAVEFVARDSAIALAEGINRVLGDEQHRGALVARAQLLIDGRFGWSRMLARYEDVYGQVVEGTYVEPAT